MTNSDQATRLAIRRYLGQLWVQRRTAIPGLLLPGIGVVFTNYIPPLIVVTMINRFGSPAS